MAETAPLLTRQGWGLVSPLTMSTLVTATALGGIWGLLAVLGLVGVGAGVSALRNRPARAKAGSKREKKPPRQQGGRTGERAAGLLARLRGTGIPLPSRGRGAAGAGGAAGSRRGGALGLLRGGAGRRAVPPRSSRTAGTGRKPVGGRVAGAARKAALAVRGAARKATGRAGTSAGRRSSAAGSAGRQSRTARALGAVRKATGRVGRSSGSGHSSGSTPSTKAGMLRRAGRKLTGRDPATGARKTSAAGGSNSSGSSPGRVRRLANRLTGRTPKGRKRIPRIRGWRRNIAPSKTDGASPVAKKAIENAVKPVGKRHRRNLGDAMPIRRRPSINNTGLRASSAGQLGRTSASGRNPFAAVIEAAGQAAQAYDPENAVTVIDWFEAMPELIDAMSGMLKAQGDKNTEDFFLYPAAAEFARALGARFQSYKGPCEEARHAFETAHAEDLERIRNPKPNQVKWDIDRNPEAVQ